MNLDEVKGKVLYDLSVAGLREQIETDRRAIAREWAREDTDLETVLSLSRHIEYCEGRL